MIELVGDEHYTWGEGINSPSLLQRRIITHINSWMDTQGINHKFNPNGATSSQAYAWIGKWRHQAPEMPPKYKGENR